MKTIHCYILLGLFAVVTAQASPVTYNVSVNTSALSGQSGYVDFFFDPGAPAPSDAASALISGFTSDGTLSGPPDNSGDVSAGTLPGSFTIDNTYSYNDYNEGFTFGSYLDFFVTLNVPVVTSPNPGSGSVFAFSFLDPVYDAYPLINPAAPDLVEIDLDVNANPSVVNYSPNNQASVTSTPEPSAVSLAALGCVALLASRVRRRRTSAR